MPLADLPWPPVNWDEQQCLELRQQLEQDPGYACTWLAGYVLKRMLARLSDFSLNKAQQRRRLGDGGSPVEGEVEFCWYLIAGLSMAPRDFITALQDKYGSTKHRCGYVVIGPARQERSCVRMDVLHTQENMEHGIHCVSLPDLCAISVHVAVC